MLDRHPDNELLERFLCGDLTEEGSRALQRHLSLCAGCEERLIALLPEPAGSCDGLEDDEDLLRRLLADRRGEISSRVQRLTAERTAAAALWRELEPFEPVRRRSLVAGNFRFQSWGFFELLIERSYQAVLEDAREAEELLRLALDVAEQLDPGEHGPEAVAAAKARAWTHLGNTLRVLSEFRLAETAFQTAELHLARSWLDPLDEALLLEFKAPLRRAQRRFGEALELIEDAIAIYRQVNEPHLQGRAWMVKGLTLRYQGDVEAAASCFRTALSLLDGLQEPRLLALCEGNLIGCLQDTGRSAEAAALMPEAWRRMNEAGKRTDRLRLRWTEGKVAASLGRPAEAEAAFLEVRQAFLADSLGFDAALISLDLATLYLQDGRSEETKRLAAEILPVFQSREVYREAAAALIVFQRAAEMEQLTLGLVDEVAAYLREARRDPHLRFRAGT
ncbi:MAG TPA: hypothetical protein VGX68_01815 [Thermoanaerobaculia bacterium]|nr:hypothetical protein [Thermoanaerobaculia bacterium]